MKTKNGLILNYDDAPLSWHHCFNENCEKRDNCLRFQTGLTIPDDVVWGNAVYPTAKKGSQCKLYKEIRVINGAYGFKSLFSEVKQKDYTPLRDQIKDYLGGHGTFYRYNSGDKLLTPEQQQWILNLFASYGYKKEDLAFEHYKDSIDFSEV